jgi:pimeloyl-ACP methyl ester carboxylesterase
MRASCCGSSPSISRDAIRKPSRLLLIALAAASLACRGGRAPIDDYGAQTFVAQSLPSCKVAIYKDPRGCDETSVLYYLHGSQGDELTWPGANREVIEAWRKAGGKAPVVVAVSFGLDWYIFPESVPGGRVPLESFAGLLMPEIEARIGAPAARRMLYGFSMGAANAAQLVFRHPELFDRVVIASPAIYPFAPQAPREVVDSFIASINAGRNGLAERLLRTVLRRDKVALSVYDELADLKPMSTDIRSWPRADILQNIAPAPRDGRLKVYVSCGDRDENGFFPVARDLARLASAAGYDATFESLEGEHKTLDKRRIASFLLE